jgi:hypothetical protein
VSALAPTMQAYFTQRLVAQRAASPNTIAAYRTTFRLLLRFAAGRTGKTPSKLDIGDLDALLIAAFLDHLEHHRHNRTTTRNNRLAAIHSLFAYLALQHPEHAATTQRVLALPSKRTERNLVTYLTETEVDALLDACDKNTWTGRRDHAMLALTTQTGLRELSPVFRTPEVRWLTASRKDAVSCLLLTLSSSVYARCSWPGPATNRSVRSRKISGSASPACVTGWPRPTPTMPAVARAGRPAPRGRNWLSCAAVTVSSKWRTRSSSGRPHISRGRTSSQSSVPAGCRTR